MAREMQVKRGKNNPNDRVVAQGRIRQDKNQVRAEVEEARNVPEIRAALVKIMDLIGAQ